MKTKLDKVGAIGVILTAIATPCCFPIFASLGGLLGIKLWRYGRYFIIGIQVLAFLSTLGMLLNFKNNRRNFPVIISITSLFLIVYSIHVNFSLYFIYAGIIGQLVSSMWEIILRILKKNIIKKSKIACPKCNFKKVEEMPLNACVYFYECTNCKFMMKPIKGDCCVFCSYGSIKCPSIQTGNDCCAFV